LQKQQKANEERALLETEEQLTENGVDIKETETKCRQNKGNKGSKGE
jgi:hypothetical protein